MVYLKIRDINQFMIMIGCSGNWQSVVVVPWDVAMLLVYLCSPFAPAALRVQRFIFSVSSGLTGSMGFVDFLAVTLLMDRSMQNYTGAKIRLPRRLLTYNQGNGSISPLMN